MVIRLLANQCNRFMTDLNQNNVCVCVCVREREREVKLLVSETS